MTMYLLQREHNARQESLTQQVFLAILHDVARITWNKSTRRPTNLKLGTAE